MISIKSVEYTIKKRSHPLSETSYSVFKTYLYIFLATPTPNPPQTAYSFNNSVQQLSASLLKNILIPHQAHIYVYRSTYVCLPKHQNVLQGAHIRPSRGTQVYLMENI